MSKSHADILARIVSNHIRDALVSSAKLLPVLPADRALRVSVNQIEHFFGPLVIAYKEEIARRERVIQSLRAQLDDARGVITRREVNEGRK